MARWPELVQVARTVAALSPHPQTPLQTTPKGGGLEGGLGGESWSPKVLGVLRPTPPTLVWGSPPRTPQDPGKGERNRGPNLRKGVFP